MKKRKVQKRYLLPNDDVVVIVEIVGPSATVKWIKGPRRGTRAVCDVAKLRVAKSQ